MKHQRYIIGLGILVCSLFVGCQTQKSSRCLPCIPCADCDVVDAAPIAEPIVVEPPAPPKPVDDCQPCLAVPVPTR